MSKWLAIVNPRSGGAGPGRRFRRDRVLDRLKEETDHILFTEYPGHATVLARQAHDCDGVAVMGGDGSVFEVMQGMDRKKQTLAIIPAGRGNSLARDLGLYPHCADLPFITGFTSRIDLMEAVFHDSNGMRTQVVSASTISLGYPTEVAIAAGRDFRRFGRLCYSMAAACVIPARRTVRVRYAGETFAPKQLTGFVVSNTRHAANFEVFPNAHCDDGLFEAMELTAGFAGQSLHNVSTLSRLHFRSPAIAERLTAVSVAWDEPTELLVDGEIYANVVSLELRVLPAALACVPRQG